MVCAFTADVPTGVKVVIGWTGERERGVVIDPVEPADFGDCRPLVLVEIDVSERVGGVALRNDTRTHRPRSRRLSHQNQALSRSTPNLFSGLWNDTRPACLGRDSRRGGRWLFVRVRVGGVVGIEIRELGELAVKL